MSERLQASIAASLRLEEMHDLMPLDRVQATLTPLFEDDLTPGARPYVGRSMLWQIQPAASHTTYGDQFTASPWPLAATWEPGMAGIGWVPLCDLADIEVVHRGPYHEEVA